ncbi:hypothetical protein NQ318_001525 [Aromia moschata]|uniref:SAP domain-containing protein n=1 Tax=Aromia moschata TaxID=1265417 RepID=A0AAV8X4X6_9CUCU|nr:hypothetical protein NQ318_001525 [Aromia moschata]
MASRQVFFKDLKVVDLKKELEERECETTGKKVDLQNRLKEALENEGENTDIFLFEIAGDINSALQILKERLERKLIENGSNLEQKLEETSGSLEKNLEEKLLENATQFLTSGNVWKLKRRKIATLSLESGEQQRVVNTALKSPGSDIDRLSKPELSSHVEILKIRMKPPQFDGKSSWVNYLRQFEAAARANGWSLAEKATALTLALRGDATDVLQTLSLEEQDDYHQLVKHLEMRYGRSHLEHVYHSQLKNRCQKNNESLQEFEADIARLVRLAYSSTPENVMERLAVQAFLDGLRDTETRQALTLARPSKLVDALPRALEFEAAKQSCRGQAKVRKMEKNVEEGKFVLAEDTAMPERSETILDAHLDGNPCVGNITVFEPRSHDGEVARGIAVGKALLLTEKTVPFLHLFLLAYRQSTKQLGKHLQACLRCDLKFDCTPGDDMAREDYVSTLRQRMDDIHERVRSNIQGASDRMKETYDINANDGRCQPGNQVWLYNPQRRRGLSPGKGPYEVVTRINNVIYRIQKLPRGKPRVVHLNRLAPFAESNDEQAESRVRHVSPPDSELSFEDFMLLHSNGQKARYGVTRVEPRDLFQAPAEFCLAHCVASDLRMSLGIALTFKKAFGQLEELRRQRPEVGPVIQITVAQQEKERSVFYLVAKQLSHHKPTYQNNISSGEDDLDWRVIISMLEVLFKITGIEILVCYYNPRRSPNERTVDCFFYQTSRCKEGPRCQVSSWTRGWWYNSGRNVFKEGQCGESTSSVRRRPVDRAAVQVLFNDTSPRCVSLEDIPQASSVSERALDRPGVVFTVPEGRIEKAARFE